MYLKSRLVQKWPAHRHPLDVDLAGVKSIVFKPSKALLRLRPLIVKGPELIELPPASAVGHLPPTFDEMRRANKYNSKWGESLFWNAFSDYVRQSWGMSEVREVAESLEVHFTNGRFYNLREAHRVSALPDFLQPEFYLLGKHSAWESVLNNGDINENKFISATGYVRSHDLQCTMHVIFEILAWSFLRQKEKSDLRVYIEIPGDIRRAQPISGLYFDSQVSCAATVHPDLKVKSCVQFRVWEQSSAVAHLAEQEGCAVVLPQDNFNRILRTFGSSPDEISSTFEEEFFEDEDEDYFFDDEEDDGRTNRHGGTARTGPISQIVARIQLNAPTTDELKALRTIGEGNRWRGLMAFQVSEHRGIIYCLSELSQILGADKLKLLSHTRYLGTDLQSVLRVQEVDKLAEFQFSLKTRDDVEGDRASKDNDDPGSNGSKYIILHLLRYLKPLAPLFEEGICGFLDVERTEAASRRKVYRKNDMALLKHKGLASFCLLETVTWLLENSFESEAAAQKELKKFISKMEPLVPAVMGQGQEFAELYSPGVRKIFSDFLTNLVVTLYHDRNLIFIPGEIIELQELRLQVLPVLRFILLLSVELSDGKLLKQSSGKQHEILGQVFRYLTEPEVIKNFDSTRPEKPENLGGLLTDEVPRDFLSSLLELQQQGVQVFLNGSDLAESENPFVFDFQLKEDSKSQGRDWFDLHPQVFFNGELIDEKELQLKDFGRNFGFIEYQGRSYRIDLKKVPSYRSLSRFWQKISSSRKQGDGAFSGSGFGSSYRLPRSQILELLMMRHQGIDVQGGPEWKRICDFFDKGLGQTKVALSSAAKKGLLPHQKVGVQWLHDLYELRLGGILADEMGLGKTYQVLAFLETLAKEKKLGKTLIVVPTSLVFNWQAELEKFTAKLPLRVFQSQRQADIAHQLSGPDAQILLTTYGLLTENIEFFEKQNWNIAIFDEAQNLKNIDSLRSSSARKLQASFKLCLTGTPMENNYLEFYSLCDLVVPGSLGRPESFRAEYCTEAVSTESLENLRQITKPLVLRRTKKQVKLDLPEKTMELVPLAFGKAQNEIYKKMALSYSQQLEQLIQEKGEAKTQIEMLAALMRLRQICSDPAAVPGVDFQLTPVKVEYLIECLQEHTEAGESVIVFTQFLSTLGRIERSLKKLGIPHSVLHGAVPGAERRVQIEKFQNSTEAGVMLMTLKTGGSGLNLTKASVVYHLEPWWNPAVENQATDRAHRMGQTKAVRVFNLVVSGTLEEKMLSLKAKKQLSFDRLFLEAEDLGTGAVVKKSGTSLSRADFSYLLSGTKGPGEA